MGRALRHEDRGRSQLDHRCDEGAGPLRPLVLPRMCPSTRFVALLAVVAVCLGSCGGTEQRTGGEIHLRFVLPRDLPLAVTVHRPPAGMAGPPMRTFEAGQAPELGDEVVGGDLEVELDVPQRLLLVVRNPLDHPVQFWSAPHLPTPHAAESALAILCFCTGDTYEVPAHGTWIRPIEVGIRRREAVDQLVVTHVLTEGTAPALPAPPQR